MEIVSAFYYPWWGAPPITSRYSHWDGGDPSKYPAPGSIASTFYPSLRPYDSGDPSVLATHMRQLKGAGIDVVSLDWWGPGSPEDGRASLVLDAAQAAALKVHFLVEPYWTTAQQLSDGLVYLSQQYGSHAALFKLARPTLYGPSLVERPVVMIYAPPVNPQLAIDHARGFARDSIFLIRGDDSKMLTDASVRQVLSWTHADGLFNYSDVAYPAGLPASPDYLLAWNVRPGFDNRRRPGTTNPVVIPRNGSATYDAMWKPLVDQAVEWAAVNSFNEWHEGSQIEPAQPYSYSTGWWFWKKTYTYENYGALTQGFYLDRTAYWSALFKSSRPS
jgi:glycoprotein endo-alpha-1,2-mannosidase